MRQVTREALGRELEMNPFMSRRAPCMRSVKHEGSQLIGSNTKNVINASEDVVSLKFIG